MRSVPLAVLLLAGAAALPAQTSAPRDDRRREPPRVDSGRRDDPRADAPDTGDFTMHRFDAGDGPGRIEILRGGTARDQRSAIGVWLGRADADGLRVERVTADGPAARAGVAAGDRLTAINGIALRVDRGESDDPILSAVPARRLERAVGRLAPGSEVELRVARDGRERSVRVRTVAPDAVAERGPVFREYRGVRPGPGSAVPFGPDVAPFRAPFDDSEFADLRRRAHGLADSARTRAAARPVLGITLEPSSGARDTLDGSYAPSPREGPPSGREWSRATASRPSTASTCVSRATSRATRAPPTRAALASHAN